jgi:hypothetical protein
VKTQHPPPGSPVLRTADEGYRKNALIGKPFFGAFKMFLVLENAVDCRAASGHYCGIRAATPEPIFNEPQGRMKTEDRLFEVVNPPDSTLLPNLLLETKQFIL